MITPSVEHRETTFRGSGDIDLFLQTWQPVSAIRGVVAFVHGISEHSGRYGYLVERLTTEGFAVAALDNRGHGRSGGVHGHIDSWSEYREDVHAFLRYTSAHFMRLPLFLYGHSLGALIASDFVIFHPQGLDGVILSGHPLQPTGAAKPYLVLIARILSRYKPLIALPLGVADDALSRDPSVVKAFAADPLVHRKVTARWGVETLEAIDRVRARAGEIQLPLFVLHGGADRVNSPEGSEELFRLVSSTDKQLRIYPGGFHEPHNDLDRELVLSDVIEWLNERTVSIPTYIDC
ncbi:MAG: lysophospholipase [Gemmatimonadaceae bacterium]